MIEKRGQASNKEEGESTKTYRMWDDLIPQ